MTDIQEMAKEAAQRIVTDESMHYFNVRDELLRLVEAADRAAREDCARVIEREFDGYVHVAAAIRATIK